MAAAVLLRVVFARRFTVPLLEMLAPVGMLASLATLPTVVITPAASLMPLAALFVTAFAFAALAGPRRFIGQHRAGAE